jgi:hypothetical protein
MKRVLYVTTNRATVYSVAAGRLVDEGGFGPDDAGLAAFSAYLQRDPGALYYLLGDVPEEDFQQENIPFTTGPDRAALVARKLAQIFRDSKLSLALSLGREPGARRDERVLFAAFTNTQYFHPWLRALHGLEARLAGVYSIALAGNALVRKLALKDGKLLMISVHRSGIRQNYFEGGKIRFSRLTANADSDARRIAEACVTESGKIQQYLEGLRLLPREAPPLKVLVLAPHEHFGVFSEVCAGGQRLTFEVRDEQAVAAKIGLRAIPTGSRAEALFCFMLALRAPAEQYAPATQRRMYRLWRLRVGILAASGALFASCAVFAAWNFFGILVLHTSTDAARLQAEQAALRYEEVRKTFPPMPTTTENLKATVARFTEIERQAATPEAMLADVSGALAQFPGIELDKIEWAVARVPGEVGASAGDVRSAAPAPDAAPNAGIATQGKTRYQVAFVSGRILLPNRIDYRGMLEYLNQFAGAVRSLPNTQVDMVKLPFDTRSAARLAGGVGNEQTAQMPAFAFRVSRKL